MGLEALFGDVQGLLVQLGLLRHVPHLCDYHGPEDEQGDSRGDGLLAEDTNPRIYRGPVGYRLDLPEKPPNTEDNATLTLENV